MKEKEFLERARAALDERAEGLDAGTLSRLSQARNRAMEAMDRRSGRRAWFAVPAIGAAAASVALLSVLLLSGRFSGVGSYEALADMDLLASGEQLELYEELDFYMWLSESGEDA